MPDTESKSDPKHDPIFEDRLTALGRELAKERAANLELQRQNHILREELEALKRGWGATVGAVHGDGLKAKVRRMAGALARKAGLRR